MDKKYCIDCKFHCTPKTVNDEMCWSPELIENDAVTGDLILIPCRTLRYSNQCGRDAKHYIKK